MKGRKRDDLAHHGILPKKIVRQKIQKPGGFLDEVKGGYGITW